jgi:hypothetical protein
MYDNNIPTDVSKSNFFASDDTPEQQPNQQNQQLQNEITLQSNNIPSYNQPYSTPSTSNNQNLTQYQNYPPSNFYPQPNNQPQNQQTFIQKLNNTTSEVLNYIKSKTPSLPNSIISNPLLKTNPLLTLTEINYKAFEEEQQKKIKEIQCEQIKETSLSNTTINTIIQNPRVINSGMFSMSYVLYDVLTEQLSWLVTRRYSDFSWLRECLCYSFPTEIIPQLPKKKIGNRRFESDFIEKRKKGLQNFIDKILQNESLKTSEPFITFISVNDRTYFEQQMKFLSPNNLEPKQIEFYRTLTGTLKLIELQPTIEDSGIVHSNSNYFTTISNFFNAQNDVLSNIHNNLKKYHYHIALSAAALEEVEKNFNNLKDLTKKVNLSEHLIHVYNQYSIFFKNWKRIQVNQAIVIKDVVNKFFKSVKNDSMSLNEVIQRQENLVQDYLGKFNKLNAKKESLWTQMDISKWEINTMENIDTLLIYRDKKYAFSKMCYQENEDIKRTCDLLGHYFHQNEENFIKLLRQFEVSFENDLEEFAKVFEPTLTDGINVWSNLQSNVRISEEEDKK